MRIQTCISRCASQLFVILVADVAAGPRVFISLGQAEVNHVYYVLVVGHADQEVVRLDVSMQESALVDELNALKHLNGEHEYGFQAELASTILIEILKRRSKQIHHKHVVVSNLAVKVHLGHTNSPVKDSIKLGLVVELGELGLRRFELNSDFITSLLVLRYQNVSMVRIENTTRRWKLARLPL